MYTLQRGGMALVASGGLLALFVLMSLLPFASSIIVLLVIALVLSELLLIAGLPAIYAMQPQIGRVGQIGLICIAVATVVAILFTPFSLADPKTVPGAIALFSSLFFLAGLIGYILVGYATTRARVFPTWIGWTLLAAGLVEAVLGIEGVIPLSVALIGYGVFILRLLQTPATTETTEEIVESEA